MRAPLTPWLCQHDFYWSERHLSERCRRCGKLRPGEAGQSLAASLPAAAILVDFDEPASRPVRSLATFRASAKVLKAQAQERRSRLPDLLDRLVQGARPTREEAIDAVLAVIEDAHSAEPVLFGPEAARYFARLYKARSAPRC